MPGLEKYTDFKKDTVNGLLILSVLQIDSCQFIIGGFIFGYNDKYFPTCSHATFYFT